MTSWSGEWGAVHYGLSLPNGGVCGDARVLAELGYLAEEVGWDGLFVEDYIVHQSDGAVPTCDPWIALAAMAVGTKQIRLSTSVTPLSRRWPWKVAREAVALDQFSNGRFILGVSSGDGGEAGFSRVNEAREPGDSSEWTPEEVRTLKAFIASHRSAAQRSKPGRMRSSWGDGAARKIGNRITP